jgi:hypothetical protein
MHGTRRNAASHVARSLYGVAMRFALALALCSCGVFADRNTLPEDRMTRAIVEPHAVVFQLRHHWTGGGDEDRGHYAIDRATGTCRALDKQPRYPRSALREIKSKPVEIAPHTTLRRAGLYLERRDPRGVRHVLLPAKHERIAWIPGTAVVVVDDVELVNVENGRRLRVTEAEPHGFLLVGDRIFTRTRYELAVYDLALAPVALWQPNATIDQPWLAPTPLAAGWQELVPGVRVRKTATELHVDLAGTETTHALHGPAARIPNSDVLVGEDWIHHVRQQRTYARAPGPLEVIAGGGAVRGTDGIVRSSDYTPKLWRPGNLVAGGAHGLALADPPTQMLWVVALDGTWRGYSYRDCPY